jgi:hypothetical protein
MKIRKGTLVILFWKNCRGGEIADNAPFSKCLGLVESVSGETAKVRDFSGAVCTYNKNQVAAIAQIAPSLRKLSLKKILEKHHYKIIRLFVRVTRGINKQLQGTWL